MNISKNEILKYLAETFPQFTKKEIERFYQFTTYVKEKDQTVILDNKTHEKKVYFILEGAVKGYFFDHKGIERVIFFRSKGFLVADIESVFYDLKPKYTFETIGETHLLRFNFSDFENLCRENPNLMELYISVLKEIIYTLNTRVDRMISMTNQEQYEYLLKNNPEFIEKAMAKDVAKYLGISPVSLSRIIKKIKEESKT